MSPLSETDLLRQILTPIPPETQSRLDALRRRLDERLLSPAEHDELSHLTQQIERWDADRLERLAELARRRQTPLRTLITELGLRPHDYEEDAVKG